MPEDVTAQAEDTQQSATEQVQTAAESETAQPENQTSEKPKGGFQKRIDRLTRRNYELEERLQRLADQHEDVLNRLAGKHEEKIEPKGKPDSAQYQNIEDYLEALADWKAEQKAQAVYEKVRAEEAKQSENERLKQVFDSYNQRVSQARGRIDDYDETVNRTDIQVPQSVQLAVFELENGPDIVYHIGKHPELAEKLCNMSPLAAVAEIGRISASLADQESEDDSEDDDSPKGKPVSSVPPPIKPVRKPAPTDKGLSDDLPIEEWVRRREAQIKG